MSLKMVEFRDLYLIGRNTYYTFDQFYYQLSKSR